MAVIVLHGEDEFAISLEINQLRHKICHPDWLNFNYTKIPAITEALMVGITSAMTPPWGEGGRLVWLQDHRGECTENQLQSWENCLKNLPATNTLLLTFSQSETTFSNRIFRIGRMWRRDFVVISCYC